MARGRPRSGRPEPASAAGGRAAEKSAEIEGSEDVARKAEAYALSLLALRPRTVHDLGTRLKAKGYSEDLVADLVRRCLRVGYLDDRVFARSWIEERSRSFPCGSVRLRLELRQKGVSAEVTAEALAQTLPPEQEAQLAVALARKKAATGPGKGRARGAGTLDGLSGQRRAKERLWSFLGRRGFGAAACQAAMKSVFGPLEDLVDLDDVPEEKDDVPEEKDDVPEEKDEGPDRTRQDMG